MLKLKPAFRKLFVLVSLAFFIGSIPRIGLAVDVGEILSSVPVLDDLRDGDVRLVQVGQSNVGVHLFVQQSGKNIDGGLNSNPVSPRAALPEVFLSLRMPW